MTSHIFILNVTRDLLCEVFWHEGKCMLGLPRLAFDVLLPFIMRTSPKLELLKSEAFGSSIASA
jgi:hypothetical protein